MKVLSTKRYNHIISWTPDGKSFSILRPKAFATEILPNYFKEAKYSSFTRKLHRWGFQRHLRGSETGAFFHKHFQRDRLDLLDLMSCHRPRETSARAAREAKFPTGPAHSMMQPSHLHGAQGDPSMMPTAEIIAEAQAMRARQHQALMGMQQHLPPSVGMGDLSDDRLNAAIELEVSRRLQERVDAASFSRLAMMHHGSPPFDGMGMPPPSYNPSASSPARLPPSAAAPRGLPSYDGDLNARLQQQANALRLARGYDDQRFPRSYDDHQQYFDSNLDTMGRGGA